MSYLSEQDFRRLWKSALISVDTSALLFYKNVIHRFLNMQWTLYFLLKIVFGFLPMLLMLRWIPNSIIPVK